ncbi:MAG TPA: hypothetical protein VFS40_01465 [Gemmatimonadales bacterium]|nr:hypothetical protein [Gemmatimonadales bacterium]
MPERARRRGPRPGQPGAFTLALALACFGCARGSREGAAAAAAPAPAPPPAAATAPLRVYVPNMMNATVSVVDAAAGRVDTTIRLTDLGFSPGAMPHHATAAPDGSAWYLTLAGDGWVLKFDRANRLVARTRLAWPGMVVLDPRRDRLYVSRALNAVNPPASLGVFRASDLALLDEVDVVAPRPHALAVDTVSGRVYTGSLSANQIAAYDPATERVRVTNVAGPPHTFVGFAISPDGSRLVSTTQLTNRLLVFDTGDPAGLKQIAEVAVDPWPYDAAYSPDGRAVWFGNQHGDDVTEVDARTWRVAGVVRDPAFAEPHGVALSPDGRTVFVSSHGRVPGGAGAGTMSMTSHYMSGERANGTLVVIDAATRTVRRVIEVGPYASAIGVGGAARP